MKTASIMDIERAINFWRAKDAASHRNSDSPIMTLGQEARALSNAYGMMIFNKASEISLSELTDAQRQAIADSTTPDGPAPSTRTV